MKQIITIGRQFGSGGREIGLKLAEQLGIKCYDKEILQDAAKKLGVYESILAKSEESASNSLLYTIVQSLGSPTFEDRLAKHEARFLRTQAEKGSCVIVGRCGNYLFREDPAHLSFFISAPLEARLKRIMALRNLDEAAARKLIISTDKKRANYYYYNTDQRWNDISQYQFILDSSVYGVDGTVGLIRRMVDLRGSVD